MTLKKWMANYYEKLVNRNITYGVYEKTEKKQVYGQVIICLGHLRTMYEKTNSIDVVLSELEIDILHFIKHQYMNDKLATKISIELLKLERKIFKFKGEENGK